jgi:hypothetical protein
VLSVFADADIVVVERFRSKNRRVFIRDVPYLKPMGKGTFLVGNAHAMRLKPVIVAPENLLARITGQG